MTTSRNLRHLFGVQWKKFELPDTCYAARDFVKLSVPRIGHMRRTVPTNDETFCSRGQIGLLCARLISSLCIRFCSYPPPFFFHPFFVSLTIAGMELLSLVQKCINPCHLLVDSTLKAIFVFMHLPLFLETFFNLNCVAGSGWNKRNTAMLMNERIICGTQSSVLRVCSYRTNIVSFNFMCALFQLYLCLYCLVIGVYV